MRPSRLRARRRWQVSYFTGPARPHRGGPGASTIAPARCSRPGATSRSGASWPAATRARSPRGQRAVGVAAAVPAVPGAVHRPAPAASGSSTSTCWCCSASASRCSSSTAARSTPRSRSPIRCWATCSCGCWWPGLRPRERAGPLIPCFRCAGWRSAASCSPAARIALNVADSQVIDIGVAGVVGADRITDGEELYDGGFAPGARHPRRRLRPRSTTSPTCPSRPLFPWDGEWDDVPAAHAAAIAFDLLAALGLLALGPAAAPGRARAGRSGSRSRSPGSPARGRSTR